MSSWSRPAARSRPSANALPFFTSAAAFLMSDLASGITADLVALSGERWIDAARVGQLASKHGAAEPAAAQVQFITGTRKALSELPVQVFQSPEARDAVLGAAQGALDRAIDKEEGLA